MSEELTQEEQARRIHCTREDFRNILGDLLCTECEDVWPCTEIRALDAMVAHCVGVERQRDRLQDRLDELLPPLSADFEAAMARIDGISQQMDNDGISRPLAMEVINMARQLVRYACDTESGTAALQQKRGEAVAATEVNSVTHELCQEAVNAAETKLDRAGWDLAYLRGRVREVVSELDQPLLEAMEHWPRGSSEPAAVAAYETLSECARRAVFMFRAALMRTSRATYPAPDAVADLMKAFAERHGRFHPDFWAAGKNCPECALCAGVARLGREEPQMGQEQPDAASAPDHTGSASSSGVNTIERPLGPDQHNQDQLDGFWARGAELDEQCDRFGLPHSVNALVRHLEGSADMRANADAWSIRTLQARIAELEAKNTEPEKK
jgi:hypothetical protein